MPVYQTEAIILKKRNFGEADRLLTLLTRNKGKITAIAKGARRITSKKGGNVEVLNLCEIQVATGANLDIITEAQSIKSYHKIKKNLEKTSYSFIICETLDSLIPVNHQLPNIFDLTTNTLNALAVQKSALKCRKLIIFFQLKLLILLGYFSKEIGPQGKLSYYLQVFANLPQAETINLDIDKETLSEIEAFINLQIEQIIEKKLHSVKFAKELPRFARFLNG